MSRRSEIRDTQILMALTGSEDASSMSMQIIDDYLVREKIQNRREQGYIIPEEHLPQPVSELEKRYHQDMAMIAQLESERADRPSLEYPGLDEEEAQDNYELQHGPKLVVKL